MVSQVVVNAAEFVVGLGVVILQFGGSFEVTDGLPHLPHLDETLGPQLSRGRIPYTRLSGESQSNTQVSSQDNTDRAVLVAVRSYSEEWPYSAPKGNTSDGTIRR